MSVLDNSWPRISPPFSLTEQEPKKILIGDADGNVSEIREEIYFPKKEKQ
jgi:hypothetical protein